MKKLFAVLVAVLFVASFAMAQNDAFVMQLGVTDLATIAQTGGYNLVTGHGFAYENVYDVWTGWKNGASQVWWGPAQATFNSLTVTQTFGTNIVRNTEVGDDNLAIYTQTGGPNTADVTQYSYDDNRVSSTQSGGGNTATVFQSTTGFGDNYLTVDQFGSPGPRTAIVTQTTTGLDNDAMIYQH